MTLVIASDYSEAARSAKTSSRNQTSNETGNETSGDTGFRYGWAKTDHKSGEALRPEWRTVDYLRDEPYATSVKSMLEKLGLPLPKKEEIFRGTHHDLLFLNSHGVVVRIGPTDVTDLMNPAILQPLGWLEDEKLPVQLKDGWGAGGVAAPLTVAIYPGIELAQHFKNDVEEVGDVYTALSRTGQGTGDVGWSNDGFIRIVDDDGTEKAVEVLLDSDNSFNGSSKKKSRERLTQLSRAAEFLENGGDILSFAMRAAFKEMGDDLKYYQRAFDAHQPLRRLFWNAFGDAFAGTDRPNTEQSKELQQKFWDTLAQVNDNAHAAIMPVWDSRLQESGRKAVVRDEVFVPQVVLHHQWTGKDKDKEIEPINVQDKLKNVIQKEHRELMKKPGTSGTDSPSEIMPVLLHRLPRRQPLLSK